MSDVKEQKDQADVEPQGIVIVANRPKAFESAANFLSRRGHPCTAVSNVKQGLQVISQKQTQYVFLSWNLKNNNAAKTYNLLTKNFGLTVIVFAEATDSKTAAELAASHLPEIMQAPVSGPGIYMKIQRIIKAREEAELAKNDSDKSVTGAVVKEETIEILKAEAKDVPTEGDWEFSRKDKDTGQNVWRFAAEEQASMTGKKGVFTFKGEKPPVKNAKGMWQPTGGAEEGSFSFEAKVSIEQNKIKKEKRSLSEEEIEAFANMISKNPAGESPEEEEDNTFGSVLKLGKAKKQQESLILQKEATQSREHVLTQEGINPGKELSASYSASTNATNEFSAKQEGLKSKDYSAESTTNTGSGYKIEQKAPQEQLGASESSTNSKQRTTPEGKLILAKAPVKMKGVGVESLLAKATQQALEESVETVEDLPVKELAEGKNVIVMTISSTRFSGYLIATSSNQNNLDPAVIERLKHKLPELLHQSGEAMRDFEILKIEVGPVNFKDWAGKSAEFTAQATHHDEEWLLMFIPDANVRVNLETAPQQMIAIEIDDVLPNLAIPFNLFIFFPLNEKYFKYVAKDQKLSDEQRVRMSKAKVSKFYIRSTEETVFKAFCIQNRISVKIVEYINVKEAVAS